MNNFNVWPRSDKIALGAFMVSLISCLISVWMISRTSTIQIQLDKVNAKSVEVEQLKADLAKLKTVHVNQIRTSTGTVIQ